MGVKVREKPKGSGVWWVFIDHKGKRKAKKIGNDEKKALEVAEKIKAKLVLGELNIEKKQTDCPTFKEYAEIWLALPHDWKESTRETYRDHFRLHVFSAFGKHRLNELTRKDLKGFFEKKLTSGLSTSTVTLIRAAMSGVFSHALDSELIETNPLQGLKLRYRKKALEVDPLTEEEADLLLKKAKECIGGIYYPSILCALRTGMRIGEIQALQWGDIDFNSRFIELKRSWRKNRITGTKNKRRRRVDMTPHLAETLKDLRTVQKRRALRQGRGVSEWVFANEKGEMLNRMAYQNGLFRCLEKAGLRKIRTHDLRHSYATIRLLRGHNVGDVSYQLGHSSISMTYDVYGHWIPGKFKSEVDELDRPQPSATYAQPKTPASPDL